MTRPTPRTPTTGLRRALFRAPILLYRAHVGWLLGSRFVLIEHIGRTTGRVRRTVVEVVDHHTDDGSIVVASGFGPTAQWYRNLLAHPQVTIQIGRRRRTVDAEPLTADEGAKVMADYATRHPKTARRLCKFLGYPADDDYHAIGARIPFLHLRPATVEHDHPG
jgi:deazaflavin-dependent oxidoreductase (nitroreductase family)